MGPAGYFLFFAGWVGHSALWLVGLNMLYSQPLPRAFLKAARFLVGLFVFGFPLALWALVGLDLDGLASPIDAPRDVVLAGYLGICWAMSLLAIPVVTVWRQLRPKPHQLIDVTCRTVDFARELGAKVIGDGPLRRMACLPGNQVFQVDFSEWTLAIPELPRAWDGLTILHLSDLHLAGTPARVFYERVIVQCLATGRPDVLAITGDLVDSDDHHRWLLRLLHPVRWNEAAFAILGNHDRWHQPERLRRRLRRLAIHVLANHWERTLVRGVPLVAIGHEGPWYRPAPDLSNCPSEPFRLCLSHTPDNIRWAQRNGVRLMLSGHNHGGQIRLPLFGSLFVPSLYSRKYDCGLFWEPPTLLHVGRGLAGKEPLRYNCRPEVARLILKCG